MRYRREKSIHTPKVLSALKTQVPQQAKKMFGVYQKACFHGKKEGKYIYTKELSRCLCGTPARSVGVYSLASQKIDRQSSCSQAAGLVSKDESVFFAPWPIS